ncbi:hypothetical protein ACIO08_11405 [Avibacterium paragallinarum]
MLYKVIEKREKRKEKREKRKEKREKRKEKRAYDENMKYPIFFRRNKQ